MTAPDQHALFAEFEALYRAQFGFVWRSLRRFGVPEAALDDAAQDVFVIVHRRFGVWDQGGSVRAWLYGVARRVASAHRRTDDRHQRKLAALPTDEARDGLEDRLGARHRLEQIAAQIDALEPSRKQVYVLIELEGLSAPEAAEALGCKLNTVYSRLRRARADLEAALTQPPAPESRSHDRTG
ncbi:RNA polymerase sigma factor [Enhygromyxa salina]|uniref:RNA polymerase sigma factor CnrH n=1 Tax=Enhygromyxa salina TaxID=215803 RepID=A0A2S9XQG3_9BACT|nr:sigma-70 family RNA polymerase sigma factor [Enhygromyxa salina]PRP95109.1 RNA polymerase sigma factor CnrH [Enhygromyxa salina]